MRPSICTASEGPASATSPCGLRIDRTCREGAGGGVCVFVVVVGACWIEW